MASLPSAVISNPIKLESEFKNHTAHFPLVEKRNYSSNHLENAVDRISLDVREADLKIYAPLLQKCLERSSIRETQAVHGHIMKTGSQEDLYLMTFLVNVYGKCGAMEAACKVFDKLPDRNAVTWTSLISAYVHNSQPERAIQLFFEMLENEEHPTDYTFGIVLSACSVLDDVRLGKEVHGYIVKYGIEEDKAVGTALSNLYSKCGRNLDSAIKAFRRTAKRDVIFCTSVISTCRDSGNSAMGLALFSEMLEEGIEPNEYTFTIVFSLCCMMQAMDLALQVHSMSIKLGYYSNLTVTNSIMNMYLKSGWITEAKKLFDGLESVSLVTWNTMIAGHAQILDVAEKENSLSAYRNGIEALDLYLKLNRSGLKPDEFSLSSVLTVCGDLPALEQGEQVHAQIIKSGFLSDVIVGTALVNMYSKCGSIKRASKAFVEMPLRTLISWTSMITAFSQHGRSQEALALFEDMRFAGNRPNKVTFVGILSACSHARMVDQALAYFEMMKNEYKIKPEMDHYACIIDMFVRLGRLDEAFDFVKKMEFEPSEFIWSMLIAGCRSHGNLEMGFYAAEQLLSLNPKDSEMHVMLLNMYLSAGRWKDVSRVRKIMKDEKIGKLRDWSWISFRGKVHSFRPDDKSWSQSEEVDALLEDLLEKSRNLGYEWKGNLEVTEDEEQVEEKGPSLSMVHHSEKLAVVFGLLNIPKPAPILVIKSISMCRDCHNFIKLVSLLTEREILVRDRKRLHRFVDGKCSCGDFGSLL